MTGLTELTRGQAEQLSRIENLWPEYGHALQVKAAMSGGMGWRTVKGVEYLTRYYQQDGKKKGKSLGRRSPETEATLRHFEDTTLKSRRIIKENRDEVSLLCRLAKAHGIARLQGRFAETLDWLWYTDANKRVALFGGTALLAYESGSGTLAPADLIRDEHLQFISHSDDPAKMGLEEIAEACGADPDHGTVGIEDGRVVIRNDDQVVAEIFRPSYFLDRLEGGSGDTVRDGLELPWLKAMTFSRDNRPIQVCAPDPRVYCMLAHCLDDREIWDRRARFAVEMVGRRWPDKFDPDQEAVLEGRLEGGWGRLRGP